MDTRALGIPVEPGVPVVGLDFDGVLNIFARDDIPPGFEVHVVELDQANWPDHPYIRPLPHRGGPFRLGVVVSRDHGRMVRAWQAAGAVVVWATTWERAVLVNAHLCDIPELPVLEISKVLAEPWPVRTADWKVAGLQHAFAGHPIVWVDDFGADRRGESTYGDPPVPMLVVAPDEMVGLTGAESDQILSFIQRNR
ncbi:MAG: hypothetical protein WCF04_08950 [Candidatus Nanopelagicales bacterium]